MQIVVVNPGDSLWSIARRFNVSTTELATINGKTNANQLVPGEALVVPTTSNIHIVQPGESLWGIARRYGVTIQALVTENNITNPAIIYPGLQLRIPQATKRTIEVNGYLEPSGTERDRTIVNSVAEFLTYVSLFSYRVQANGDLVALNDSIALDAIKNTNAVPMMVITNFSEGNFSPEIARNIFSNNQAKERLISNVINTLRDKGFYALNIDFENLKTEDKNQYNQFLRDITSRVKAAGYLVSTALAPKTSAEQTGAWYGAHDYAAHGDIVDFVIIMTYEWGWSGGPPLPVAPIPNVRKVLDYAVSVIPRNKIIMGAPLYGYDWTLPYVKGGPFAKVVSPTRAVNLAWRRGAIIQYDSRAEAPFFNYYDDQGKQHIVWFEDARSMQAKFDLINEYGLRGISYWVLGREFPQNWALLEDNFKIRKYK